MTHVWVTVGEASYSGRVPVWDEGPAWVVADRDEVASETPLGILLLAPEPLELLVDDGSVERRDGPDGGTVWSMTSPHRDGTAVQEWRIGTHGGLESWTWEFVGVSPVPEGLPYTSGDLSFTILGDAEPLVPPDTDRQPDPDDFGLPADFPLEPG